MPAITEDMIRKRAEHNEGMLSTLEEVSLHQQDIEKIEYLDKWCRELKILYLQSNLIDRIENVKKLKKLEYLNLALNNVELIENLEGCESLKKLDLTVNFVSKLTSIETLKDLEFFEELYLTGNPCTQYEGYRDYVIATLPHLRSLDGQEIPRSERILAEQRLKDVRPKIIKQEQEALQEKELEKAKEAEKADKKPGFDGRWYTDINRSENSEETSKESKEEKEAEGEEEEDSDKENDRFWKEKVAYTPESRKAIHERIRKQKEDKEKPRSDPNPAKKERRLETEDGRRLNVNEAGLNFDLIDDDTKPDIILEVHVWKYLSTEFLELDVQPTYVLLKVKGKAFQLILQEEVKPDSSTAQRAASNGHLIITMPKVKAPRIKPVAVKKPEKVTEQQKQAAGSTTLEVDPSAHKTVDFGNIVGGGGEGEGKNSWLGSRPGYQRPAEKPVSEDFEDDPDVPPLE